MYTGIISFVDRVAFNIKSNDIKDIILNQLASYNVKIIQKHYYKLDANNIKNIKNQKHLCNLRSNGNPYYIFMTTYNEIPIIYYIDKKIHPNYQKPRIILGRGLFKEELFKDTLFDGEMVKKSDGKWTFLINDIIVYKGVFLEDSVLPDRLKLLYDLIENCYTPDSTMDVCDFKVKNYYYLYKESIAELIELSKKLNYTCRGIYIWSYNLKHKPKLYNFDESTIINVVRYVKDDTNFKTLDEPDVNKNIVPDVIDVPYVIKETNIILDKEKERDLWVMKTTEPDIYKLYDSENINNSNNIGIALIPTMSISKMMRATFKNSNVVTIAKYKCIFNEKFNKWTPIKAL
jgi:hypothetical protein